MLGLISSKYLSKYFILLIFILIRFQTMLDIGFFSRLFFISKLSHLKDFFQADFFSKLEPQVLQSKGFFLFTNSDFVSIQAWLLCKINITIVAIEWLLSFMNRSNLSIHRNLVWKARITNVVFKRLLSFFPSWTYKGGITNIAFVRFLFSKNRYNVNLYK